MRRIWRAAVLLAAFPPWSVEDNAHVESTCERIFLDLDRSRCVASLLDSFFDSRRDVTPELAQQWCACGDTIRYIGTNALHVYRHECPSPSVFLDGTSSLQAVRYDLRGNRDVQSAALKHTNTRTDRAHTVRVLAVVVVVTFQVFCLGIVD